MAITFNDVALAAEEIKEAGENPTIERVRLQLGGRGSNSTIVKHLHTLRKATAAPLGVAKTETPNVVQAAVESAWNRLREQADHDVAKIQAEANHHIASSQKQAADALEENHQLKQKQLELQSSYHQLSSEKEILSLDFKKLQEDHRLLQERHAGLGERYQAMQAMTSHQLSMAAEAHQNEIRLLAQQSEALKLANQALVDEIKTQNESERHQKMMVIEDLKTEQRKQDKKITDYQTVLNEHQVKMSELNTSLQLALKERDLALAHLQKAEDQWKTLENKYLVSDAFVKETNKIPALVEMISHSKDAMVASFSELIASFSNEMKGWVRQMELKDE